MVWVKLQPLGDRRFVVLGSIYQGPFWVSMVDPQPCHSFQALKVERLGRAKQHRHKVVGVRIDPHSTGRTTY